MEAASILACMAYYLWKNISGLFVALGARQRQRVLLVFKKDRTAEIENILKLSKNNI